MPFVNEPLVPDAALPGGVAFTLTVNGTGFVSGSVVNWNAAPLATTFVSGSQLTAIVPAANVAASTTASVAVSNPPPGGGVSNVEFFVVSSPATTITFTQLSLNPAVLSPLGLITADFNGDGKLDLAYLTNATTNNVIVQLGNGDGTFQPPLTYSAGTTPVQMVAADFNGDGKLDLAVVDEDDNTVSVLLGNGDGTFQPQLTVATGPNPSGIVAADFNGDGKLDLAVGSDTPDGGVFILLGNGDGTFQPYVTYGTSTCATYMAGGDFSQKGKLDLVYADCVEGEGQGLWFLQGNGDGSFQPPVSISGSPSSGVIASVMTADLNGDGRLDLITADLSAWISRLPPLPGEWIGAGAWVSLGNGDGTFQPPVQYAMATGYSSFGLAVQDFNADGILDLALANLNIGNPSPSDGTLAILLGSGDGTFQNPIDFPTPSPGGASLVAGDFNGDGKMDFAVAINSVSNAPVIVFLQGQLPIASASPTSITFTQTAVDNTSQPQTISLTNPGAATLTLISVGITGADAGDFAQTNNCGSTLAPNASCGINVTFTPTARGTRTAAVSLVDNASGSPQSIALSGTGVAPVVNLSPSSLTFPGQFVGTTGLPENVTLTNNGDAPLSISSIQASAQFAASNGCTTSLAAGVGCTISVFFDPSAAGTQTGTLTITDNAPDSPQTVQLSGVGMDFQMSSSTTSQTLTAGQTATYSLTLAPEGGLNQMVSLKCSGTPSLSACTLTPSQVTLNGTASTTVAVAVTTTAGSLAPPWKRVLPPSLTGLGRMFWLYAFLGLASVAALAGARQRRAAYLLGACLLLVMLWSACGGGAQVIHTPGTPAGTYTLDVTATVTSAATSSTLTHDFKFMLTVD
ncbi:MAG: FG-GAP-like repeat-containing protein [Terriglobia bacterium]